MLMRHDPVIRVIGGVSRRWCIPAVMVGVGMRQVSDGRRKREVNHIRLDSSRELCGI